MICLFLVVLLFPLSEQMKPLNRNLRDNFKIKKITFHPHSADIMVQEKCSTGLFVTSVKIITGGESATSNDARVINALEIECSKPEDLDSFVETRRIDAGNGPKQVKDELECNGFMFGFNTKDGVDEVKGLKLFCGNPLNPVLEGGIPGGSYKGPDIKCLRRQAICGIFGSREAGTLITMRWIGFNCCNVPDPAAKCRPKDRFETLVSCDNAGKTGKGASLECTYTMRSGVDTSQKQGSSQSLSFEDVASIGFSAGFSFAGLGATFESLLTLSKTTGMNWGKETSKTFIKETETTATFSVPPGVESELDQVVGSCGVFSVRPNSLRKIDKTNGKVVQGNTKGSGIKVNYYFIDKNGKLVPAKK